MSVSVATSVVRAVAVLALAGSAAAQVVPAKYVIKVNDVLPGTSGLTCTALNDPYTNSRGKIGFTGNSSGGNFVWYDTGVVWLNSNSASPTLTGAEGTMGISDTGGFIYSPSAGGNDAVWTHAGLLLAQTDLIPSLGMFSTFNSRPRMTPGGAAFWVGGITATSGGSTSNRALLYTPSVTTPNIVALIIGGGTYGGLTITTTASNFAYDISDSGAHRVHVLQATGAAATDMFVHHSSTDSVIAREGFPVPGFLGETYVAFRIPSVNDWGNWIIAADTSGATATDEIVVYNDNVVLREGLVLPGATLSTTISAISLNNRGRTALIFGGTPECLVAGAAANLSATARVLLKVGDQIDIDNDSVCDYIVTDFNASAITAPGLDLADDGMVWVNVDLGPCSGGAGVEAIIGVRDVCPADFNMTGSVSVQDIFDFLAAYFNSAPAADFNGSGSVSVQDIFDYLAAYFAGCE